MRGIRNGDGNKSWKERDNKLDMFTSNLVADRVCFWNAWSILIKISRFDMVCISYIAREAFFFALPGCYGLCWPLLLMEQI